jgi:two-component system chemotaxis sensor kinase CheA
MDMKQILQTFILEAQELLAAMEEALLAVEGEVDKTESINAMFRAMHTIKGSAGLFGLDPIVKFAHTVESVLDRLRARKLTLTRELVGLMLECHDHLAEMITEVQEEAPERPEVQARSQRIIDRLVPYLEEKAGPATGLVHAAEPAGAGAPAGEAEGADCWHISIRFSPDVFRNGMDPASFIRYLATLGSIVRFRKGTPSIPRSATWASSWTWTRRRISRPWRTSSSSSGRTAGSASSLPTPRWRSTSSSSAPCPRRSGSWARSWWRGAASPSGT